MTETKIAPDVNKLITDKLSQYDPAINTLANKAIRLCETNPPETALEMLRAEIRKVAREVNS